MRMTSMRQVTDTIFSDLVYGSSDAEYIELTWGDDRARAYGGNDVIWDADGSVVGGNHIWLSSNDTIYGGEGDDLIFAGLGADSINGDSGIDRLDYRYSQSAVVLDIGAGVGRGDARSAAAGDRFAGIEHFLGSAHGDTFDLTGMAPRVAVTVDGSAGNDRFVSSGEFSVLIGGAGNDTFVGGGFGADLFGGDGNDVFDQLGQRARAEGGAGSDTLTFASATSPYGIVLAYYEHSGIERIVGSAFRDDLTANAVGNATITTEGAGGNDILRGSSGNDLQYGGTGSDSIQGNLGNDSIWGGDGVDNVAGDSGTDWLRGGAGNDIVTGGTGFDYLWGDDGDDFLNAGSEGMMMGGNGADVLILGGAAVTAYGGSGTDTFVFGAGLAQGQIADFEQGTDMVNLDAFVGRFLHRDTLVSDGATALLVQVDGKPAGRIDWVAKLGDTLLRVDRDLDGDTDYNLMLTGQFSFTENDFLL